MLTPPPIFVFAPSCRLNYPNKATAKFVVDDHSKVLVSFKVTDQATKKVTQAHQVFVRFTGTVRAPMCWGRGFYALYCESHHLTHHPCPKTKDGAEVFFVAEAGSDGVYVFDLVRFCPRGLPP